MPCREWARFLGIDLVFLLIVSVLVLVFIITSVYHLKGVENLADEAVPLAASFNAGAVSPSLQSRIAEIDRGIGKVFFSLAASSFLLWLTLALVIGSWNFVGIAAVLKRKLNTMEWVMYSLRGIAWFFVWGVVLILPLFFFFRSYAALAFGLVWSLSFFYFSVVFFYSGMIHKGFEGLILGFREGVLKISMIGPSFIFCVLVLLFFNLAFLIMNIPFTALASFFSVIFFTFYLSWSRHYMCIELGEVFPGG